MKKRLLLAVLALASSCLPQLCAQTPGANPNETPAQRDVRMAWMREARFGLFIHWGVYSVPAGFYHGQPVRGLGEWIMSGGRIPMAEYQQFAKEFNPVKFNADEWVSIAKNAGMKYIVITSKHHDGFAMFDTKASDWNIVKATPYAHDPLKDLAEACRKQGIKLGFYYSQAQDWNNGGSATRGKWDLPAQQRDMDDYIDKIAIPQVRELLSNYGEFPAVLWWDTPTGMNPQRAQRLYDVAKQLKPEIIMNNRLLGGGFTNEYAGGVNGDTQTPEQFIPAQGYPGRDWETCMTMNNTWGFRRDDNAWKSTETLIRNLCDIASKGGNYLLNVGPTSEGLIPQPSIDRLAEIGKWMKVNGEAIWGTSATPFGAETGKLSDTEREKNGTPRFIVSWDWRCTTKPGKIYAMIFKWPEDNKFVFPGLQSEVRKAYLLADPKRRPLNTQASKTGVTVSVPDLPPDAIASVVCLEIADAKAAVAREKP
jgi:alpha-L-fucosidase